MTSSPKEGGGGLLLWLIISIDCKYSLSWTKWSLMEGAIFLVTIIHLFRIVKSPRNMTSLPFLVACMKAKFVVHSKVTW